MMRFSGCSFFPSSKAKYHTINRSSTGSFGKSGKSATGRFRRRLVGGIVVGVQKYELLRRGLLRRLSARSLGAIRECCLKVLLGSTIRECYLSVLFENAG